MAAKPAVVVPTVAVVGPVKLVKVPEAPLASAWIVNVIGVTGPGLPYWSASWASKGVENCVCTVAFCPPPVTVKIIVPATLVSATGTLGAFGLLAWIFQVPATVLAVKTGELTSAIPVAPTLTVVVAEPPKFPEAPVPPGFAVKVTVPETGLANSSRSWTCICVVQLAPTVTVGQPPVMVMVSLASEELVSEKVAVLIIPAALAETW